LNTDRWYFRVFQCAPDLIRALLPGSAAAANALSLDHSAPGDSFYRLEALEIKGQILALRPDLDSVVLPMARSRSW
jgi:hypothetical protein